MGPRRRRGRHGRHGHRLNERQGRLVINYSWGNQQGVEHLVEAVYDGTEAQFLRGWFPAK